MGHLHWPLFDLEVHTPRLTLRYIDDELGAALVDLASQGVHDPDFMPFAMPWTDVAPDEAGPNSFRYWWRCRAETTVDSWDVNLAVIEHGQVVGATGLGGKDFPITRWFETGSWLGRRHQGRGLGTELRVATLQLGFLGFDGEMAGTGAFFDNGPSLGVTNKLGYEPNGVARNTRRGRPAAMLRYRMDRAHFVENLKRDDITISGDRGVRELLGLGRPND
jgi:RimJ/RimL family protein N-acetyltransferase